MKRSPLVRRARRPPDDAPAISAPARRVLFVPVDVAKTTDFTAVGVLEPTTTLDVHLLHRFPRKTEYHDQGVMLRRIVDEVAASGALIYVIIDGTGVGQAVVEIFERALRGSGAQVMAVSITAGMAQRSVGTVGRVAWFNVSRGLLINAVRIALETHTGVQRLRLLANIDAGMREIARKEMDAFSAAEANVGTEAESAGREGEHDDIVLMLALGCWFDLSLRSVGSMMVGGVRSPLRPVTA